MTLTKQIEIPMPWGYVKGQIFNQIDDQKQIPILCLHGFLDNSNSFRPLAKCLSRQTNAYYLIAIDLPGQGLSSKLGDANLYNFKSYILSVRKVVLHLNLKSFVFLTHSFGCTLSLLYMACFPDNVNATILLDFVFALDQSSESLSNTYKESIEKLLENESSKSEKITGTNEKKTTDSQLTYDMALERILKANRHIDELSGKILLERSLKFENNRLEFSRDTGVPKYFPIRFHLSEFMSFKDCIVKNINTNILHVYAFPYAFGEIVFKSVSDLLEKNNSNSRKHLKMIKFEDSSSHHFHMIKPHTVANIVLKFLDEQMSKHDSKL